VRRFREALEWADLVIISTPEYNHSIPGQLKNAIDWASRPGPDTGVLAAKPTVVISASTSAYGGQWAQEETKKALRAAGARVLDVQTPIALARAQHAWTDGAFSERKAQRLQQLVEDAVSQTLDLLGLAVS
jgi:chromate reductase